MNKLKNQKRNARHVHKFLLSFKKACVAPEYISSSLKIPITDTVDALILLQSKDMVEMSDSGWSPKTWEKRKLGNNPKKEHVNIIREYMRKSPEIYFEPIDIATSLKLNFRAAMSAILFLISSQQIIASDYGLYVSLNSKLGGIKE